MTDLDREQVKRDCADTLEVLNRDQQVDEIARLADAIRVLGPAYRTHGEVMQVALRDRNDNTITWDLIHVLGTTVRLTTCQRCSSAASRSACSICLLGRHSHAPPAGRS